MYSKKKFSALALVAFSLQMVTPTLLVAAGTCSLSALDTVAGLGTQVTLDSCTPQTQVSLSIIGPSGSDYTQTVQTDGGGKASTLIPSKTTIMAGEYRVTTESAYTTFTVIPDRADDAHSILSATPKVVAAGGNGTVTVSAVLRDRYDNPVANRSLALISNRATDEISPQMHQTDDDGKFLWTIRPKENGLLSLFLYDIISGKQMNIRTDVTVGSGGSSSPLHASLTSLGQGGDDIIASAVDTATVDRFSIELPQNATEVKANELFSVTIRALNGTNLVRGYIGTLIVESSDPDAELPKKGEDAGAPERGRVDVRNVDQGERKVPLSFLLRRSGTQTITVYDALDPAIKGEISLNVVREGSAEATIVILDPKDRTKVKGAESILLQGRAPSLINLKVKGGRETVDGESDSEGVFRITVPLHAADKEVTLFVTSENGTYESQPVHIILDNDAPTIDTVTAVPAEGKTEEPAVITVTSEPDLTSVVVTINGTDTVMTATGDKLYVASVTAPAKEGVYDLKVVATDSVGNVASTILKWTVTPRNVPVVSGVSAESLPGQVLLKWKAISTIPIAQYKIYIATEEDPTNTLYSIDTKTAVTSALIKDLPLGKKYLFSLTAVSEDGTEGGQKSVAVAASPLGFAFRTKPGTDNVLLEWDTIANLPLSQYILQYGTEPGVYTERRTVSGQATSIVVRDLLPGVTYEFLLTPVTVTGNAMTDISAVARVNLADGSFVVGAADPAPEGALQNLHSGADLTPQLRNVPSTTTSGISTIVLGIVLLGSLVLGVSWMRLRREQKKVSDFLRSMQGRVG